MQEFVASLKLRFISLLLLFQLHFGVFCWAALITSPVILDGIAKTVIDKGNQLVLPCTGSQDLDWTFANPTQLNGRTHTNQERWGDTFTSTLTVDDAMADDTGRYICGYRHPRDGKDFIASLDSTSIYVYVRDVNKLFAPLPPEIADFPNVAVHQNQENVIPCRPTFPEVEVTLRKVHPPKQVSATGQELMFDPHQGFVILYPNIFFEGSFECVAQYKDKVEVIPFQLFWIPGSGNPPQPFINDTLAEHVVVDSPMTLECTINTDTAIGYIMSWTHPITDSLRVEVSPQSNFPLTSSDGHQYYEHQMTLQVRSAQFEDQGLYSCHVRAPNGRESSREQYVVVHKAGTSNIDLKMDFNTAEPRLHPLGTAEDFKVVVKVSAHPEPTITWSRQIPIKGQNATKTQHLVSTGKYDLQFKGTQASLVIKDVVRDDSGLYTVRGVAGEAVKEVSFTLWVTETPKIFVHSVAEYLVDQPFSLNCVSTGRPFADVHFEWKQCETVKDCKGDYRTIYSTLANHEVESGTIPMEERHSSKNTIKGVAKKSGFYRCRATNMMGTNKTEAQFHVVDVLHGVQILPRVSKVFETAALNITCRTSKFLYDRASWVFQSKGDNADSELGILPDDGYNFRVALNETTYSYVSELIADRATVNMTGMYKCVVLDRLTSKAKTLISDISVVAIEAPQAFSSNMDGLKLAARKESQVELECEVRGVPFPTILWAKDGEPINLSNSSAIGLSSDGSRLIIPRVLATDNGLYVCTASNMAGTASLNTSLEVLIEPKKTDSLMVIIVVIIFVVLFLAILFGVMLCRRIRMERQERYEMMMIEKMLFDKGDAAKINPDMDIHEQIEYMPYDRRFEFPRERLKLGKVLGQGAFGRVLKAEAIGLLTEPGKGEQSDTVAVKMLKEKTNLEQRKALTQELKIMIQIGHHVNVLNVLGAVTKDVVSKGELMVIVEYCRFGQLRAYLLKRRSIFINQVDPETGMINTRHSQGFKLMKQASVAPGDCSNSNGSNTNRTTACVSSTTQVTYFADTGGSHTDGGPLISNRTSSSTSPMLMPISTSDLICFSYQIACGMEYLAAKKLIHRDLAARNVLVADHNVMKICDFGLAKDCYSKNYYKKKGDTPLPIKWMSIEAIRDKIFTTQNDVWSFGIVLWELFTLGGSPYPGIQIGDKFYERLVDGYRLNKPDYATDDIYQIMSECWRADPDQRPSFSDLVTWLGRHLDDSIVQHLTDLNESYNYLHPNHDQMNITHLVNENFVENTPPTALPEDDYLTPITSPSAQHAPSDFETSFSRPKLNRRGSAEELEPMLTRDDEVTPAKRRSNKGPAPAIPSPDSHYQIPIAGVHPTPLVGLPPTFNGPKGVAPIYGKPIPVPAQRTTKVRQPLSVHEEELFNSMGEGVVYAPDDTGSDGYLKMSKNGFKDVPRVNTNPFLMDSCESVEV